MRNNSALAFSLLTVLAAPAPLAWAREEVYDSAYDAVGGYGAQTLDERVAKLEKRLSGETLMEMLKRMDQLQGDMASMRGKMEELSHELDGLRKQQKDMYLDLEQRLQPAATGEPPADGAAMEGDAQPAAALPEAPSVPQPVAAVPAAGRQEAYDKAFNLLKEGKYPESVRAFKSFLSAYPSGELADNALYWTGEAYYVLRDYPGSRDAFRNLIQQMPQSQKVPDALLKIGYIEYETRQWANARQLLTDVVKRYPGTNAAKLAESRLAKMKQEGH